MKYRVLVPLIALGACGAVGWYWSMGQSTEADVPAPAPQAIVVDIAPATRRDVPIFLQGIGTVQALNTVTVSSRVDGHLQKIAFTEGQDVKAGDLLAQIDPRPFKAALDQAIAKKVQDIAQLKNAELDLQRFVAVYKKGFATNQEVDTQQALVNQLQAQIQGDEAAIENAQTEFDYTTVTAPIAGRTGFRLIDEGNIVHAADTNGIVTIAQIHPISVVFTLPEDDLTTVTQAMSTGPVRATALATDGTTELDEGEVALVDNQIDQATGTARIKAEFPNSKNLLWPGQFVNVRILVRQEGNALTIPSAAVQHSGDGPFVYVVKPDSTVEVRPVKVGGDTGGFVMIDRGIQAGERVVVDGQYRLQPGARIRANDGANAGAELVEKQAAAEAVQ